MPTQSSGGRRPFQPSRDTVQRQRQRRLTACNDPIPPGCRAVAALPAMNQFSVLFVCMGNLCRSPTAHGVFHQRVVQAGLAERVRVDSAGTHAGRKAESPDARAQTLAQRHGYALGDLRSRSVADSDFLSFNLLLAMDHDNLAHLRRRCPPGQLHRVRLLTDFSQRSKGLIVPDPYYGNARGFEVVLDLIEDACDGLMDHVQQQLSAPA